MTDDRMRQLLRRADGGPRESAGDSGELLRRVPERAARKMRTRRALGLVGVAGAFAIIWIALATSANPRDKPNGPTPQPIAHTTSTPAATETAFAATAPDPFDLLDPVTQSREQAACTIVFLARGQAASPPSEETRRDYERAIALFPESRWARVARQELEKLHP